MIFEIIDNGSDNKVVDKIYGGFADAEDVRFAVAYVSRKGWDMISEVMENNLSRGIGFEIILGLSELVTEPEALETLYRLSRKRDNVNLYCYFPVSKKGIFHPKVYLFIREPWVKAFVGSSNLTSGGLKDNNEINIMITANIYDELISEIIDSYNRIKYSGDVVIPDEELLNSYTEARRKVRTRLISNEGVQALKTLRSKVTSLGRPSIERADLFGWSKLVYDRLPRGVFTTSDIYSFEEEFAGVYPENKNIKAKIRQQLQYLRDVGLLNHVKRGSWRK